MKALEPENAQTQTPSERLKTRLNVGGVRRLVLKPADIKKIFQITDSYVAARVFAVLAGRGQRAVTKDAALAKLLPAVSGTQEARLQFLFDLHDIRAKGKLRAQDIKAMLDASLRQNEIRISPQEKKAVVSALFHKAEVRKNGGLDFADFKKLVKSSPEIFRNSLAGLEDWFLGEEGSGAKTKFRGRRRFWVVVSFLATMISSVVWRGFLVLGYVALNLWLGWNAFEEYRHAGANLWTQIARSLGAMLNLNGALVLLPMLRGLWGWVRKTPLARLVPVDDVVDIHKFLGTVLLVIGLLHTAAHTMNYLTLSRSLTSSFFQTAAGLSGVVALGLLALMWLFARNFMRRSGHFELFQLSHGLFVVWFAAMLVHAPHFWMWAAGPLVLYLVEWVVQRTRKRHASVVVSGRSLPGAVTELVLHRPDDFLYQPGDFLYLKVPAVSRFEWHPFTISSNPEDSSTLTLHIRSAGNWTKALAGLFDQANAKKRTLLPVQVSGPYGTPSNRIFRAKQVVLVGAGIGVTPFASILRSLMARQLAKDPLKVEKVHFVWLNRGQESFDWFGDLLSDLEEKGPKGFFNIRIYLTNAEVRPEGALARIGMDLVLKGSQRDLTTGLRSKTRFGRPDWDSLFEEISNKRGPGPAAVFFCGPAALGAQVRAAALHYGFHFRKENF